MSGSGTRGVGAPAFALVLACLAIALRVVVPQGYMVAPTAHSGSFPIVLCTPQGAQTVEVDGAGRIVRSSSETPADHPCAFAGFGGAFAAQAPMLVAAAGWLWVHQTLVLEPQTTPGRGLAAPPPPPTGPPLQI